MNDNLGKEAEKKIREWRPVCGYEGRYEVSNHGEVRSLDRFVRSSRGSVQFRPGKMLKIHRFSTGYCYVVLSSPDKNALVHRLVANAFLDNSLQLPEVNHKDADKTNNDVSNLEWVTSSENHRHAIRVGVQQVSSKEHMIRMTQESRKKCSKRVRCVETGKEYISVGECANDMGIRKDYIYEFFNGAARSCHGYHFVYV